MTAQDLKDLQQRIKFDAPTMSIYLGISYDQCRKYLCGQTAIPSEVERAALELEQMEKVLDAIRLEQYEEFLAKQPCFMSEVSACD